MEERFVRRVSDGHASFAAAMAWAQQAYNREFSKAHDVQVIVELPSGATSWNALVSGNCIIGPNQGDPS